MLFCFTFTLFEGNRGKVVNLTIPAAEREKMEKETPVLAELVMGDDEAEKKTEDKESEENKPEKAEEKTGEEEKTEEKEKEEEKKE